jgi:hypothetical protein
MLCELSAGGCGVSSAAGGSHEAMKRREFIALRSGVMAYRSAQQQEITT